MAIAEMVQEGCSVDWTADAAYSAGDVIQLPDGRAGVVSVDVASGDTVGVYVSGIFKVAKTTSMKQLPGLPAYFDHSAEKAHYKKVNDRDFYLGLIQQDAAEAATVGYVALNVPYNPTIDALRDPCLSVNVGTAAAGGFGYPVRLGGSQILEITATNEAQKTDLLSVNGFATGANAIVRGVFRVISDGSNATQDFNIGVANGTHASDADDITESVFIHIDGNSTNIAAESDDGTTQVAATDTTVDYTEGSAVANQVEFWLDMRSPADVQIYVNGANVLPSSVFDVSAATGPWFLLAHLEKSSSTDVFKVGVDALAAHLAQ